MTRESKCWSGSSAGGSFGTIWLIGWLFTIGLTSPSFWKAVLGILIWPYFLGVTLR